MQLHAGELKPANEPVETFQGSEQNQSLSCSVSSSGSCFSITLKSSSHGINISLLDALWRRPRHGKDKNKDEKRKEKKKSERKTNRPSESVKKERRTKGNKIERNETRALAKETDGPW